jgi:hypothetical protein
MLTSGVIGVTACFAGFIEPFFIFNADLHRGDSFEQNDKLYFFVIEILLSQLLMR